MSIADLVKTVPPVEESAQGVVVKLEVATSPGVGAEQEVVTQPAVASEREVASMV